MNIRVKFGGVVPLVVRPGFPSGLQFLIQNQSNEHSNPHFSLQLLLYSKLLFPPNRLFPKAFRHKIQPQIARQFQRPTNPGNRGTERRRKWDSS